jgi:hypothetical protein
MAGDGSLSAETALAAKKVKGAWTIRRLLYLLDSLAKYDIQLEKKRNKSGWATALSLIASIVAVIWGMNSENGTLMFSALVFAILFIFSVILLDYYRKRDLPNDFREYLIPLLRLLSGDIRDRSKIALNIDLLELQNKKHSKGKQSLPPKAPYNKITLERFERTLMTMAIHLRDGNRLLMERFESLTVIAKSKKNPRGKTKTKAKYKKRVSTRMKLAVNGKVYAVRKKITNPAGAQVIAKTGAKRITLDMKLAEKGGLDIGMKPDSSIKQIAFLYSCIAPVKRGDNRVP